MISQKGQLRGKTHYLRLSLSRMLNAISLIFYFSSGQLLDLCEYRLCAHSVTPLRSMVLANVFEIPRTYKFNIQITPDSLKNCSIEIVNQSI